MTPAQQNEARDIIVQEIIKSKFSYHLSTALREVEKSVKKSKKEVEAIFKQKGTKLVDYNTLIYDIEDEQEGGTIFQLIDIYVKEQLESVG